MTEFLRPGYSNISCTEDHFAFSSAVMPTELEVSLKNKNKVFLKRIQFLNLFVREKGKLFISIQRQNSIPFKQLLYSERNTC